MIFDFSFILVVATLATGIIWGLDSWLFKPNRLARAQAAEGLIPAAAAACIQGFCSTPGSSP